MLTFCWWGCTPLYPVLDWRFVATQFRLNYSYDWTLKCQPQRQRILARGSVSPPLHDFPIYLVFHGYALSVVIIVFANCASFRGCPIASIPRLNPFPALSEGSPFHSLGFTTGFSLIYTLYTWPYILNFWISFVSESLSIFIPRPTDILLKTCQLGFLIFLRQWPLHLEIKWCIC